MESTPITASRRLFVHVLFCVAVVLAATLAPPASAQTEAEVKSWLGEIWARYPSMTVHTRRDVLEPVAKEVLGATRGARLVNYAVTKTAAFQAVRRDALSDSATTRQGRRRTAVVSGQSITGMMAAIVLARSGYEVVTYEMRDEYTRNIQWAARQSLIDELGAIDPALAERFQHEIAGELRLGSVHINEDSTSKVHQPPPPQSADPLRIPASGSEMIEGPSVVNVEAKVFEKFLANYLESLPNVRRVDGQMGLVKPTSESTAYGVEGLGTPDLIVVAEGGSSKTREALGIESVPTSFSRWQLAGVVQDDQGGTMRKQWRSEGGETLITGTMTREGSGKTWVVADIQENSVMRDGKPDAELVDREFRRLVAMTVSQDAATKPVTGAIEGKSVSVFELRQNISSAAVRGSNVIGFGDFVGNGHWSVGGGMQVGAVSHAEALKDLLLDFDRGRSWQEALSSYEARAFEATEAWSEVGLADFFDKMPAKDARAYYRLSVKLWRMGEFTSPLQALGEMLPQGRKAVRPYSPCYGLSLISRVSLAP